MQQFRNYSLSGQKMEKQCNKQHLVREVAKAKIKKIDCTANIGFFGFGLWEPNGKK